MQGKAGTLLRKGIGYALDDYQKIAANRLGKCVKPKEDQLKAAIYRAYSEAGYVVHVEPAYERGRGRCDLMVATRKPIAIELKTAWAGDAWNNKPDEQHGKWLKDIDRLSKLPPDDYKAVFALLFAYQEDSEGEAAVRAKIDELKPLPFFRSKVFSLTDWNGLNKVECMAFQVF